MKIPPPEWDPSIGEYHTVPILHSVSASSLKRFRTDRQAFQEELRKDLANPHWRKMERKKSKSHEMIGQAVGGYFLDQDEHENAVELMKPADRETARRMIETLMSAPTDAWAGRIRKYLRTTEGRPEWTHLWAHPAGENGFLNVRIRCDKVIGWPGRDKVTNFEFKTSRRTTLGGFRHDVEDFEYYRQLALQDAGLRDAFPGAEVESLWGFISSTPPHRACILRPDPVKLAGAAEQNTQDLEELSGLMAEMYNDPTKNWGPRREPWELAGVPEYA